MPPTKRTPARRPAVSKSNNPEELMEFESFVSQRPKANKQGKAWMIITLLILIIVLAGALWFVKQPNSNFVKDTNLKAVALDNGQVYYAQVAKEDALNIYLDDVYYIQTEQRVVPAEDEDSEDQVINVPVLVKRGDELHKPTGLLQINRDRVVGIETIGEDSEILLEIQRLMEADAAAPIQ
jgi:hypothetical protein